MSGRRSIFYAACNGGLTPDEMELFTKAVPVWDKNVNGIHVRLYRDPDDKAICHIRAYQGAAGECVTSYRQFRTLIEMLQTAVIFADGYMDAV